ncbi:VanZ family protein [Chengkuizengella axinellae]|uniref:VanZ family protein n=1 Tax=Chengkuizengella axinellae TaxID=3064388 RepID=A0ABT9IU15_9BACL|nr:VanZ family protein [Chengkuizengella sp. 2205SS18-9]MDP5272845.1 VanZ family protein [Chengkuizengella sp. 2205SS18-9]
MKTILRGIIAIMMLFYLFVLIYWMFIGFGRTGVSGGFSYNLTPFSTIKQYFYYYDHFNREIWIINILGNIGVFIPFGIFVPFVLKYNLIRFMYNFIISITCLELLQLVLKRGSFDIDDIILNSFGALIGFIIYKVLSVFAFKNI